MALSETKILSHILRLVSAHPWNNILQIKVLSIFEELFANKTSSTTYKVQVIRDSSVCEIIAELAESIYY